MSVSTDNRVSVNTYRKRTVLFVLIGLLALTGVQAQARTADVQAGIAQLENIQAAFREVARKALPSVVSIQTTEVITTRQPSQMFPFFFRDQLPDQQQQREYRQQGLGSGVIVRRDGTTFYVLTNAHVVGNATEIGITLSDGRKFEGKLVGADDRKDLALVSFTSRENIPVAALGDSGDLFVGDWVLAVGSPLGFEATVTYGIVSAIGRNTSGISGMSGFTDYIQTDAAINRGNSGGALVNIRGEVIGINSWIASTTGGNIGLGFAIPINNAKTAIDDFITKGRVEYGWLGIGITQAADAVKAELGLERRTGSFVYSVYRDSPAEAGGILPGDFIIAVNGTNVTDTNHLLRLVGNIAPGRTARFRLVRLGREMEVTVRVTARDDEQTIAQQASKLWPGFMVAKVDERLRDQLRLARNAGEVVITNVEQGSPAAIAGLTAGDIIQSVNGKTVNSVRDFYAAFSDTKSSELLFTLYRQGNRLTIGLSK
jgi:serine protease Do